MTPFGRQNLSHKFPRNAGFYLTARNPPLVHVELLLEISTFEVSKIGISFGPDNYQVVGARAKFPVRAPWLVCMCACVVGGYRCHQSSCLSSCETSSVLEPEVRLWASIRNTPAFHPSSAPRSYYLQRVAKKPKGTHRVFVNVWFLFEMELQSVARDG